MGNSPSLALSQCLVNALGRDISGLAIPGKPLYDLMDVKPYNLNYIITPAAVTYPKNAEQVAGIVKCAAKNGFKVQARSGGHSYANYCLGGADRAIVVDLKNFQHFSINQETFRAAIGAGTLLKDIDERLHNVGGRAISHGTCPQVGIGGHATIGGLGPTSRMWGSTLDHVEEVQVVLANSSIVRASRSENPDLFFALRGAGASFGVITEFKVRTQPELGSAVRYKYAFSNGFDATTMAAAFRRWQALVSRPDLTRRFATQVTVLPTGLVISGTFFGSQQEFNQYNLSNMFPPPFTSSTTVFSDWLGLTTHWVEQAAIEIGGGVPSPFYSKSLAIPTSVSIPDQAIDALFKYIASANKFELWFLIFDLTGGAISDVPLQDTSYRHRDIKFFMQPYVIGSTTLTPQVKTFLNDMVDIVRKSLPSVNLGSYAGYVDPALSNPQQAYWGTNLPRLERIKRAVDPMDIFHNPQSVKPARA